jgi:type VI secretion system secreted protein Hcp
MKTKLRYQLFLLLAVSLFSVSSGQAAFDAFLVFTNVANSTPVVKGESQDQYFGPLNGIEISEFSFGIQNPVSIGSATTGAGAGKATFGTLTIKKTVDSASPSLFSALGTGGHFNTVTLFIRKAGGSAGSSGAGYLKYTFKLVFVSSINWSGSSGDDVPTETVTFAYGAMQIAYQKQTPDGKLAAPVIQTWNQLSNSDAFDVQGLP